MLRPRLSLLLVGLLLLIADIFIHLQQVPSLDGFRSMAPLAGLLTHHVWLGPLGIVLTWAGSLSLLRDQTQLKSYQSRAQLSEKLLYLNSLLADANQQLQASEQHCRDLLEGLPQMVWTADATGAVTYFNQRWYDYSGLSEAQSMGLLGIDAVHPADRDRTLEMWSESLSLGRPFETEYRIRRHDGIYHWFISRGIPLRDAEQQVTGWIGTITDIHQQKQIQHELTSIMEAVPAAVWIAHDPECHTVTANMTAYRLMRRSPGSTMTATPANEPYPFPFKIQIQGEDVDIAELPMQRAGRMGQACEGEFEFVFEDGTVTVIYGKAVPLRDELGTVQGVIGAFLDVTEQKRVAKALRQKQERLDLAQSAAKIGSFEWNIETNVNIWSPELEAIYGLQPGQFEGTYEAWLQRLHPEDRAASERDVQAAMKTGELFTYWRVLWPDNKVRWLHARAKVFYDAQDKPQRMVGVNMDVTDRKEAEAALQQSELMFRTLANTLPQLFWVIRPDTYPEYVNSRWCDYIGKSLAQFQAEQTFDFVHPEDQALVLKLWQAAVQTGGEFQVEQRLRRASDGEYRWHLSRALPFHDSQGRIIKWFGSSTDIHDQKMAIEERALALERERSARIALERASRTKDEFLAIVSHELRSPLNGILGWARLMRTRQLPPDITVKALESIERNAQAQTQLIEDLLDISRIIRGNIRLNLCPTSLMPIVEAALDTIRPTASTKSIEVVARLELEAGFVLGDPDRLQQIIWNLLANAVKFTPAGGQVEICLESVGPEIQVQVIDTGQGIDPDFLPYVFDRFRQADATTVRSQGGLGLGLAIVRNLTELHGGSVAVTSPGKDQGTTFTVRFPLHEAATNDTRQPAMLRQSALEAAFDLQGLKILVVDDETDAREFVKFLLEQYGAEVAIASSAQEAQQLLPVLKPNLLLSDIGMPGEDGYSLIRKIRTLPVEQGGQIPAAALTAYARESDRIQALDSGFNVHVPKPIEPIQLLTVLTRLAER
ncbi:MAG TPA: PAS domain-containing protein [Trichocoleus sp.]